MKTKYANKVNVFTNGYSNHPDIIVAKMIAEHYNLNHTINVPSSEPTQQISIEEFMRKIMGSVYQTDGTIELFNAKGYERASSIPLAFPGHINEVFGGFTNKNVNINSLDDCVNYYKTIHLYDPMKAIKSFLLGIFEQKFRNHANICF